MAYKDKAKQKANQKAYYEACREHIRARQKAYQEEQREHIREKRKAYRQSHHEKVLAREKASRKKYPPKDRKSYRTLHRERIAIKRREYYLSHKEKESEQQKKYASSNPDVISEINRKRRANKKNATVCLTSNEKQSLLVLERVRQELERETGRAYHIDHILPLAHGGLHHPVNLRILESTENISKRDKLLPEAIALAPEHFRLYSERVSPERAWEFVRQLAAGLGLSEDDLDALITGKPLKSKPTLEDFFT